MSKLIRLILATLVVLSLSSCDIEEEKQAKAEREKTENFHVYAVTFIDGSKEKVSALVCESELVETGSGSVGFIGPAGIGGGCTESHAALLHVSCYGSSVDQRYGRNQLYTTIAVSVKQVE